MVDSSKDPELRIAQLESQLATETSMVSTLRTFLEQGRKEREHLLSVQADNEAIIAKLRLNVENQPQNSQRRASQLERDLEKFRVDLGFMEKQYLATSEKLKNITTEKDSLSTQLKALKRLNADLTQRLQQKPPTKRKPPPPPPAEVPELPDHLTAFYEFEISMKNEEIRKMKAKLEESKIPTKRTFQLKIDFARPLFHLPPPDLSDAAIQATRQDFKEFRRLKAFIDCACGRATGRMLTMLPCGHPICEGCYKKCLEADCALRGWPCSSCGTVVVSSLPAVALEKVGSAIRAAERELENT